MKKRSQNKFENAIMSCIRKAFAHYSPKYYEVWERSRVEEDTFKKDGDVSAKKAVFRVCNVCGKKVKNDQADVDHIHPVIPVGKTRHDLSWDEVVNRIDCDIENLQVICDDCHSEKTKAERKLRSSKNKKNQ